MVAAASPRLSSPWSGIGEVNMPERAHMAPADARFVLAVLIEAAERQAGPPPGSRPDDWTG
jgi:hypothetical protein